MPSEIIELVELKATGVAEVDAMMEKLVARTEKAVENQERLAKAMDDPRYAAAAAKLEKMKRQKQEIAQAEREQMRVMQQQQSLGSRIAGVGRAGAAMAGGMYMAGVRSGFSGTVEGHKLSQELQGINRELAATFMPLMRQITKIAGSIRRGLEGLGGGGQDLVMAGGLAASAYGAYGGAKLAGRMAGFGRVAAPMGQAAAGIGAGEAAAIGAASGGGVGRSLLRKVPMVAAAVAAGKIGIDATQDKSHYQLFRESGDREFRGSRSKVGAALSHAGMSVAGLLGADIDTTRERLMKSKNRDLGFTETKRDNIHEAQAGFSEVGSAYARVADAGALQRTPGQGQPMTKEDAKRLSDAIDQLATNLGFMRIPGQGT